MSAIVKDERPIIFGEPMIRAILEGKKTQTRRLVLSKWSRRFDLTKTEGRAQALAHCPYGKPGDRLWVRETWCNGRGLAVVESADVVIAPVDAPPAPRVVYRADGAKLPPHCPWRPSIHMPRWASRIDLEVVSRRVEKLQRISADDIRAEGLGCALDYPGMTHCHCCPCVSLRDNYRNLWDKINGKRAPWQTNPSVFVVEFRRVS